MVGEKTLEEKYEKTFKIKTVQASDTNSHYSENLNLFFFFFVPKLLKTNDNNMFLVVQPSQAIQKKV